MGIVAFAVFLETSRFSTVAACQRFAATSGGGSGSRFGTRFHNRSSSRRWSGSNAKAFSGHFLLLLLSLFSPTALSSSSRVGSKRMRIFLEREKNGFSASRLILRSSIVSTVIAIAICITKNTTGKTFAVELKKTGVVTSEKTVDQFEHPYIKQQALHNNT